MFTSLKQSCHFVCTFIVSSQESVKALMRFLLNAQEISVIAFSNRTINKLTIACSPHRLFTVEYVPSKIEHFNFAHLVQKSYSATELGASSPIKTL